MSYVPDVPVLAMTATASHADTQCIRQVVHVGPPCTVKEYFQRLDVLRGMASYRLL